MNEKENTKISKFLSLVLRHQPELIGIKLDGQGWIAINELLEKAKAHGIDFNSEQLSHVVDTNVKKRFAFSSDGEKIRASQGHSVEVELGYEPQTPPEILYHGTATRFVDSILTTGLERRTRQHVHLGKDIETTISVARRHGKPVLFEVLAGDMYKAGCIFFLSANGVWLTDAVPVEYLRINSTFRNNNI